MFGDVGHGVATLRSLLVTFSGGGNARQGKCSLAVDKVEFSRPVLIHARSRAVVASTDVDEARVIVGQWRRADVRLVQVEMVNFVFVHGIVRVSGCRCHFVDCTASFRPSRQTPSSMMQSS